MTPPIFARTLSVVLVALVITSCGAVAATVLPDHRHITVSMANGGSKYVKFDASGLNALHITTNPSSAHGQTTVSDAQSGTFFMTDTGGRGYSDGGILLVAVREPVNDGLRVRIRSSGYTWTPSPQPNTMPTAYDYRDGAVDATFGKDDFIYGPQDWKPSSLPSYPIHSGQSGSDRFLLMFVDLRAGTLGRNTTISGLKDDGAIRIQYSFENLDTFAAFNVYGWCLNSNQGEGISWTNTVGASGASGFAVRGIQTPTPTSTPVPTYTTVAPTTLTATTAPVTSITTALSKTTITTVSATSPARSTTVQPVGSTASLSRTPTLPVADTTVPTVVSTASQTIPVTTPSLVPADPPAAGATVVPATTPEFSVTSRAPVDPLETPAPVATASAGTLTVVPVPADTGLPTTEETPSREREGYTGLTTVTTVPVSGTASPAETPPSNGSAGTSSPTTLPYLDIGPLQEYSPVSVQPGEVSQQDIPEGRGLGGLAGSLLSSNLGLLFLVVVAVLFVFMVITGFLVVVLVAVLTLIALRYLDQMGDGKKT
ncbi:MAG: hypothetical protein GXY82_04365 [Methanospirillum sp.]|nr:hypothetical protein [Methanospirillum sp.]